MGFFRLIGKIYCWFERGLKFLAPFGDVIIRVWIFNVFFYSGLNKLQSWDSTLALFANEYHVPLLPPEMAAYLGTAVEFTIPILLVLGLFGRLPAVIL